MYLSGWGAIIELQAMGLDAIELILRIEDEFAIEITDDEAEKAVTVGNLHDLVVSKLAVDGGPGLMITAFHQTRNAIVQFCYCFGLLCRGELDVF